MVRALTGVFGANGAAVGGAQILEGREPAAEPVARPGASARDPKAPSGGGGSDSVASEGGTSKAAGGGGPVSAAEREARRDIRLDFFRGLGMFIILIAHTPWNGWNNWIPARFGYSDATEIFVFCSGAASAIAFLKSFEQKGWWVGTARVSYRIYQLYWCHIGVFFAVLTSLLIVDGFVAVEPGDRSHVGTLNLSRFVDSPETFLPELFTLHYIPNLFDILPMYMVVLAMMPLVIALGAIRPWLAMAFSVAVWALASQPWLAFVDAPVITLFNLPAEPAEFVRDDGQIRTWFFNPFAWQLIFFTGFAFSVGWLPAPPVNRSLLLVAGTIAVASIFLDPDGVPARRLMNGVEALHPLRDAIRAFQAETGPLHSKMFLGLFRYVHFLAIAYLAWVAAGEAGRRLPRSGIGGLIVLVIRRVGQQSLAVFVASLVIARLLGVVMWEYGITETEEGRDRSALVNALVNLIGFAAIIAVAYIARYFRNPPWKRA
ncbi:MAG: OpgC domain-containing protein [Pseudomonadota bacterium]